MQALLQDIALTKEQLALELLETRRKLAQVTAAYERVHEPPRSPGGKPALRSAALARRGKVDDATRLQLASRLADVGAASATAFLQGRDGVVSLYAAIGSEPSAQPLAEALAALEIPLALPVDWSHGGPLIYRRWTPEDRLASGPLGIAEPLPDAPECEPDVLVIPLVAYDRRGCRIGYGAGNVDMTLTRLRARKSVLVIGVAFSVQEELLIPDERHDQRVDVIVTERETITITG